MNNLQILPDILTVEEVATYLRVSKTTICRWCNDGTLPAFRIGRGWRVRRNDLAIYINEKLHPEAVAADHNGGESN